MRQFHLTKENLMTEMIEIILEDKQIRSLQPAIDLGNGGFPEKGRSFFTLLVNKI